MSPVLSRPLPEEIHAVNVGLAAFGETVREQGGEAVDVAWRIPAGDRDDLLRALTRLYGADSVDTANAEVFRRLDGCRPRLVGVGTAVEEVPQMTERTVLHCGPPLDWEHFCDPLRRSVIATIMAEGWASQPEAATALIETGEIELSPANDHQSAIPMASSIGPTSPVLIVEDPNAGTRAYSGLNQGPGQTAWFGVDSHEAVERLKFLHDSVGSVLSEALKLSGPVDVFSLVAQGVQMGDDAHMRTQATTNLLIRHLLPYLTQVEHPALTAVAEFLSTDHLFFLNIAMAAAKATVDWAAQVPGASVVTGMARNGTTFGIRLGTLGDRWFIAEAPPVLDALYSPGFGPQDGAPDIGDSAVLELVGLGGAAAAASPAVASFLGGMSQAVAASENMDHVSVGRSSQFKIPFLDMRGTALAIDVRAAVETGITPAITTGILHRSTGAGQVGAGVAHAPLACFEKALLALDSKLGPQETRT